MKPNIPNDIKDLALCIEKPYFIFEWDNVLPEADYQKLKASFPAADLADRKPQDAGKLFVNDRQGDFHNIIAKWPEWDAFYRAWKTQDVIDRLQALVAPYITHRPAKEQRRWKLVKYTNRKPSTLWQKIVKGFYEKVLGMKTVRLGFEFSTLPDGAAVPLHTDAVFKLVSLLYYFPDPGWDKAWGGGTCFYQNKPGFTPWTLWKSYYLEDEKVEQFHREHDLIVETAFSPNRISGFVKTDNSWHEVKPLHLPPGVVRQSLCINVFAWG